MTRHENDANNLSQNVPNASFWTSASKSLDLVSRRASATASTVLQEENSLPSIINGLFLNTDFNGDAEHDRRNLNVA